MTASPEVVPILEDDLDVVAEFLHEHMNPRISVSHWRCSIQPPWPNPESNFGFCLRAGDELVGVYSAIYADRTIGGVVHRFCNLAAWCVLPDYRTHSVFLLKKLLKQKGMHFTDLSPRPDVADLMRRLGFRELDSTVWVVPNLPWPGRSRIVTDHEEIASRLEGQDRQLFLDHRELAPVEHLLLEADEGRCHVVYQRIRKKRVPCVAVLYASAPTLLRAHCRRISAYFLRRCGALLTLFDPPTLDARPPGARPLEAQARLFRSAALDAATIDNLYSERVTLPMVAAR